MKKIICVIAVLMLLSGVSMSVLGAQSPQSSDYPNKNIELICPSGAGTGFDALARKLAATLPDYLPNKVNVFVSNLQAGGGAEGWTRAYYAEPDGYTLLLYGIPDSLIAQELYDRPYDIREMTPLAGLTYEPTTTLASIKSKVDTLEDLIEKAKNSPVVFGTSGAGSSTHIESLVTTTVLDIPVRYVHYANVPEVITGFERGETEFLNISLPTALMWIREEKVKPLVVYAQERQPELPDVPTIYEIEGVTREQADKLSGIQQYRRAVWGPPGMDPELRELLTNAIKEAVMSPEFQEWSEEVDRPITFVPGTEFNQYVDIMYNNHLEMMDIYRASIGGGK